MSAVTPVSETDLEEVLRTDPEFAVKLVDSEFRQQILRHIKRKTWGRLQPAELLDAYQETMRAFIKTMRLHDFDPSRPLRIINTIAARKGLDQLRGRKRSRLVAKEDDFLEAVAQSLRGSDTGAQWRLLTNMERKEFMESVMDIVLTLPERQKLVAGCFLECYEQVINEKSFRALAEAVSAITGRPETVVNVKSNWHAARKKISEVLCCDFNFIRTE